MKVIDEPSVSTLICLCIQSYNILYQISEMKRSLNKGPTLETK